jgi:hypothetical protein
MQGAVAESTRRRSGIKPFAKKPEIATQPAVISCGHFMADSACSASSFTCCGFASSARGCLFFLSIIILRQVLEIHPALLRVLPQFAFDHDVLIADMQCFQRVFESEIDALMRSFSAH